MKYVSLDIETTGVDPKLDQVLMLSMVVEDSIQTRDVPVEELPHFTCYLKHERYTGNAFALSMNCLILEILADKRISNHPVYMTESLAWQDVALSFLDEHFGWYKKVNVAGKNVAGFDIPFLPERLTKRFRRRVIDVGGVCIDWDANSVLSLDELKQRNFVDPTPVAHDALEDARDVIRLLRTTYPEF